MLEGNPENWAAVARAISDRFRELGWRQRKLAERPQVSVAVVGESQRHTVERRRSPRTLEALSAALGWEPEHLDGVLKGQLQQHGHHVAPDDAAVWSRLDSADQRLDEIVKLLAELNSGLATVIDHVRDDRWAALAEPFGPCAFHGRKETGWHPVCGSVHRGVHSCTAGSARGCFTSGEAVAR